MDFAKRINNRLAGGAIGASRSDCVAIAAEADAEIQRLRAFATDAMGKPRTRYVRVSLAGNHCVMHPSEGDCYLKDARDAGDESVYIVADVWLSEREFDDLPEHDGF